MIWIVTWMVITLAGMGQGEKICRSVDEVKQTIANAPDNWGDFKIRIIPAREFSDF